MRHAGVLLAALVATAAVPAAALPHHDLTLVLEPAAHALHGVDRLRLEPGDPRRLLLDPAFAVDRLALDGNDVATRPRDGVLTLPATAREADVEWHGTLAPPPSDTVPDAPVLGPEGGWLAASAWMPTVDGARFTYTVTIDVPRGQRAVTAGRLVSRTDEGERTRTTFAADGPAEALAVFTGPWSERERDAGGVRVRTLLHADVAALADDYLARTAEYLALYAGWIGPYPYSAFTVASAPFPAGLGYPALTYLGTQVLQLPFIKDTSLGHEVLHAWWGNGVFVDVREGNWCEGLTAFMADYTFAERRAADAARDLRLQWLRELALLPAAEDVPIAAFVEKRHTASQVVGYHKAALVLAMLRDRIGADAFADGVRRFAAAHRFAPATWSDLRDAFAAAADVDLRPFFAAWIRRAGAPVLSLRDPAVRRRDAGGVTVTATLVQEGGAPWPLDVPVVVESDAGATTTRVRLDGVPSRPLVVDVAGTPHALEVDPEARVVRRLARDEVPPLVRHVAYDPAAVAVVAAAGDAAEAARTVAARLLEGEGRTVDPAAAPAGAPLLLVGTDAEVVAALAALRLADVPTSLAGRGDARVWAARRRDDGAAAVVVQARDAAALRALARPLPHLAASSWIVFDGGRANDRGVWEPTARPLRVALPAPHS